MGVFLGFIIVTGYFGLLGSRLGGGKTLGKRLLNQEVIDETENYLSIPKSIGRYSILFAPYFLYCFSPKWVISFPFPVIIFKFGLEIILLITLYLIIFDRNAHQGLHDKIFNTYVLDSKFNAPIRMGATSKRHYKIIGVIIVCFISLNVLLYHFVENRRGAGRAFAMHSICQRISQYPYVRGGSITDTNSIGKRLYKNAPKRILDVQIQINKPIHSPEEVRNIARFVLDNYPFLDSDDGLSIAFCYGYDLGISKMFMTYGERYTRQGWEELLQTE